MISELSMTQNKLLDVIFAGVSSGCMRSITTVFSHAGYTLQLRRCNTLDLDDLIEKSYPDLLLTEVSAEKQVRRAVLHAMLKHNVLTVMFGQAVDRERALVIQEQYPGVYCAFNDAPTDLIRLLERHQGVGAWDEAPHHSGVTAQSDELERHLASLSNALDVVVVLADLTQSNSPIIFANEYVCRLTGFRLDELRTMSYWDLFGSKQPTAEQIHTEHLPDEASWFRPRGVTILKTKSGMQRNIRFAASIVPFGGQMCLLSAGLDVTDAFRTLEKIYYQAQLLQNVNDAIISLDKQFVITSWNHGAEQLYGWSADEMIGQRMSRLDTLYCQGADTQSAIAALERDGIWQGEVEHLRKDGTRIEIENQTRVIRTASGEVVGYVGINRDISLRKVRERELVESESRFRLIADALPALIWVSNTEQKTTFVNARWRQFTGQNTEADYNGVWRESVHPDDRKQMLTLITDAVTRRVAYNVRYRFLHHSGDYRWLLDRAVPFYNRYGRYTGYVGLSHDISDQVRAENKRAESEQRFQRMAEDAPVMIWMTDADGKLAYVNRLWRQFTGAQPGANIDQIWVNTIHPDDLKQILTETRLVKEYMYLIETEHRWLNADGEYRWILNKSVPRFLPGTEEFAGFISVAFDTTVRRRAEDALLRNHQYLEAQVKVRTQVIQEKNEQLVSQLAQRQRAEARERELRTFSEALINTMTLVNSTLDLNQVFDLILQSLDTVVAHDAADIMIVHDGIIKVERVYGYEQEAHRLAIENMCFTLDQLPTLSTVLRRRRALVIRDTAKHSLWTAIKYQDWVKSYMCAPIIGVDHEVIGFINTAARYENAFNEEHAHRLEAYASQIAFAIRNAQAYESSVALARLEERQALARDLHDSVSQYLFTASLMAEMMPMLVDNNHELLAERFKELHQITRSALAQMRNLLLQLTPEKFAETSPTDLINRLVEGVKGRARGLEIASRIEGDMQLPADVKRVMYRIIQESLNNIIKHSAASKCELRYVVERKIVTVIIEDNGEGFSSDTPRRPDSMGLETMAARAEEINGNLKIYSVPGQGTKIIFTWKEDT